MQLFFDSDSEAATAGFAAGLAALLSPGDVVLLRGQLGSGKTFFVREAARALGVNEPVTSPSFTLANSYKGSLPVHHLDLYRLPAYDIQAEADFSEFFSDDAITFVEWPEVAETRFDDARAIIDMEHAGKHRRRLRITVAPGELRDRLEELIDNLGH